MAKKVKMLDTELGIAVEDKKGEIFCHLSEVQRGVQYNAVMLDATFQVTAHDDSEDPFLISYAAASGWVLHE